MNKRLVVYGVALALVMVCLKLLEYRLLIIDHSLELYGGALAIVFTVLGVYAGKKLTGRKEVIIEKIVTLPTVVSGSTIFNRDTDALEKSGISKREYEILQLMAEGCSNQEIADRIFVSINTVKTHGSNLFMKLDVQRRTQAVKKAKELNLIP